MTNLKTQGFILIDVDVVALNNAGKSSSSNFDNAIATKKIRKGNRSFTYVSGQAWRFWWRSTLEKQLGWELSPLIRDSKVVFTSADPISFPDDDIFGYMRAAKGVVIDDDGNPVLMKNGKEKTENVTVTRVAPLKNSAIISVTSVSTEESWSSMARQNGDSVPYSKEEYSAIMKGMFSLELEQVGTFATYNKTGFKNLTESLKEKALAEGASEIDDLFVKDKNGNPKKLVRLQKEIRQKRIVDTLKALKVISGGAMQTSNMGDVTPKFIILSTMTSGNHPFSTFATATGGNDQTISYNFDALEEVINDYKDQFQGNIFIGVRKGFFSSYEEEKLQELVNKFEHVHSFPVNEAIDKYCMEVVKIID